MAAGVWDGEGVGLDIPHCGRQDLAVLVVFRNGRIGGDSQRHSQVDVGAAVGIYSDSYRLLIQFYVLPVFLCNIGGGSLTLVCCVDPPVIPSVRGYGILQSWTPHLPRQLRTSPFIFLSHLHRLATPRVARLQHRSNRCRLQLILRYRVAFPEPFGPLVARSRQGNDDAAQAQGAGHAGNRVEGRADLDHVDSRPGDSA